MSEIIVEQRTTVFVPVKPDEDEYIADGQDDAIDKRDFEEDIEDEDLDETVDVEVTLDELDQLAYDRLQTITDLKNEIKVTQDKLDHSRAREKSLAAQLAAAEGELQKTAKEANRLTAQLMNAGDDLYKAGAMIGDRDHLIATLREQNTHHANRIAAQAELLSKAAKKQTDIDIIVRDSLQALRHRIANSLASSLCGPLMPDAEKALRQLVLNVR